MPENKVSEIYEEYSVHIDSTTVVFFFNSGLCLNHLPLRKPKVHTHYHNELFTVFRGKMYITTEQGTETISAGETVLIPAGLAHKTEYSDNIIRATMGFVNPEGDSLLSPFHRIISEMSDSGRIIRYTNAYISQSVDRILSYVHGDFKFRDVLIKGCIQEIAALLCQNGASTDHDSLQNTSDSRNYRRYIISETFERAFLVRGFPLVFPTLEDLGRQLHLSRRQTEREVKAMYGRTFSEQIFYLKMKKAQELLSDTDMSANSISSAVGYSSTRNFFLAFKKYFGMTPGEYRERTKRHTEAKV